MNNDEFMNSENVTLFLINSEPWVERARFWSAHESGGSFGMLSIISIPDRYRSTKKHTSLIPSPVFPTDSRQFAGIKMLSSPALLVWRRAEWARRDRDPTDTHLRVIGSSHLLIFGLFVGPELTGRTRSRATPIFTRWKSFVPVT